MTSKLDFVRLCGEAQRLRHTYDAGCRNILRFEVGRHINNRVENSHLLFRRVKTLQKFAPVHASIHNHFNLERHLVDCQTYEARRSVALAEWRALAA